MWSPRPSGRDGVGRAETRRVVARRGDLVIAETRARVRVRERRRRRLERRGGVPHAAAGGPGRLGGAAPQARWANGSASRSAVVITDTFGRPWREGVVNVAIGCAGIPALVDLRGTTDHHGRELEATVVALADEVAAASGLVMGKAARVPAAIVRGRRIRGGAPTGAARDLVRPPEEDLFRESPLQAHLAARPTPRRSAGRGAARGGRGGGPRGVHGPAPVTRTVAVRDARSRRDARPRGTAALAGDWCARHAGDARPRLAGTGGRAAALSCGSEAAARPAPDAAAPPNEMFLLSAAPHVQSLASRCDPGPRVGWSRPLPVRGAALDLADAWRRSA